MICLACKMFKGKTKFCLALPGYLGICLVCFAHEYYIFIGIIEKQTNMEPGKRWCQVLWVKDE